jgi:hypothetical protein
MPSHSEGYLGDDEMWAYFEGQFDGRPLTFAPDEHVFSHQKEFHGSMASAAMVANTFLDLCNRKPALISDGVNGVSLNATVDELTEDVLFMALEKEVRFTLTRGRVTVRRDSPLWIEGSLNPVNGMLIVSGSNEAYDVFTPAGKLYEDLFLGGLSDDERLRSLAQYLKDIE